MLGRLEDRRLMSVSAFVAEGGVLTVQGTTGAESVNIYEDKVNGTVLVEETTPGSEYSWEPFFREGLSKLALDLGDGNDTILVDIKTLRSTLHMGTGVDDVTVYNGGTWIYVDAGDDEDLITVHDLAYHGTMAFGGSGDDAIKIVIASKDIQNRTIALGGNGSDTLTGSGGEPDADPETGTPIENHGSGYAILCGGNGNDILVSYNYETLVDGGNGNHDLAILYYGADEDSTNNVEDF